MGKEINVVSLSTAARSVWWMAVMVGGAVIWWNVDIGVGVGKSMMGVTRGERRFLGRDGSGVVVWSILA